MLFSCCFISYHIMLFSLLPADSSTWPRASVTQPTPYFLKSHVAPRTVNNRWQTEDGFGPNVCCLSLKHQNIGCYLHRLICCQIVTDGLGLMRVEHQNQNEITTRNNIQETAEIFSTCEQTAQIYNSRLIWLQWKNISFQCENHLLYSSPALNPLVYSFVEFLRTLWWIVLVFLEKLHL